MKKSCILLLLALTALAITACANATTETSTPAISTTPEATATADTSPPPLTPSQMQHNPSSFQGTIYVKGTVTTHNRLAFAIVSEDSDFVLGIDYRGNQALPPIGSVVVATGTVGNRPCCGYFLNSTRFYEEGNE